MPRPLSEDLRVRLVEAVHTACVRVQAFDPPGAGRKAYREYG